MHNNFGQVSIYSTLHLRPLKCRPIELEDILHLPTEPTLIRLDSTLKRFTSFCASYHGTLFRIRRLSYESFTPQHGTEQFLQTSMQLEHACDLLLQSELFVFHSERMCNNIVDQVQKVCNRCSVIKIELRLDTLSLGHRSPPPVYPLQRPALLRTQNDQFPSHS